MNIYVNPGNTAFQKALNSDISIDKSGLITAVNNRINKTNCYMCVSRPRRFGKSMAADMLAAYYSKGCDSGNLFAGLKAENEDSFGKHLNRHNVIRLDIQRFLESEEDIDRFINEIESRVIEELMDSFSDCKGLCTDVRLKVALDRIFNQTGKGFIFIIDEWDCVFRIAKERKDIQKNYLDFLRGLFKGSDYVELAYMTGILPIKKYGDHSAINIFREFSMLSSKGLAAYFGFTEDEVKALCLQFQVDYEETKKWYDGYSLGGLHIYNPQAVVELMESGQFHSYWTGTETYEALKTYIDRDFDGMKQTVVEMLGNMHCKIDPSTAQNDMTTFKTKDDVLTLLVHLGYLAFDEAAKEVFIPNLEITQEFMRAVKVGGWDGLMDSLESSERLLQNTWALNGKAVAEGVAKIHNKTASLLKYNSENSLTCTVLIAYYSYQLYYMNPVLEMPSGNGIADVVYLPRRNVERPALLVELKWNKSTQGAIDQIKKKQYASWFEEYTGDILLVGINYHVKTKKHECIIENM